MSKRLRRDSAAVQLLKGVVEDATVLRRQLDRANRIIGWMMPYIGNMAPPDGGLGDLNDHFMENKVPNPKREKDDRPIKQNRRGHG